MKNIFQSLPLWKTETELNVDTGWVYPEASESVAGSPYLTGERENLIRRGEEQIREVSGEYLDRINRIMMVPNLLALVLWAGITALTVYGVTTSVNRNRGTFLAVVTCVALLFAFLYCARGLIFVLRKLCALLVSDKLKAEDQVHREEMEQISHRLKSELAVIENSYFEKVVDAQFKYGANNTGIAILADWCCQRMMKVLEMTDKRQFLEKITAGMRYTVFPDRVPVFPQPQLTPDMEHMKFHLNNPDPKEWTFFFKEHSIYDIQNDVYNLVGCAQALATHIQEKLPEHMTAAGYDPLMAVEVSGQDNVIELKITTQNPRFVPFMEM